ncbi:hypothetical protein CEXT_801291 [Caerostris extrusa]|uniref:Uncharacterized protein n=1 Tax=Caerostris extrusa TaxID=172846 RepID=A0AAV4VTA3_CAEEX|nr:hypothetical protein CEXT_801291 [Caerostris extrusa]
MLQQNSKHIYITEKNIHKESKDINSLFSTCGNDEESAGITLRPHVVSAPAVDYPEVVLRPGGVVDSALGGGTRRGQRLHVPTRRGAVELHRKFTSSMSASTSHCICTGRFITAMNVVSWSGLQTGESVVGREKTFGQ